MAASLQVFNAPLYASLGECDDVPYQCIAPTMKRTRCQWHLADHDLMEAEALREQAQSLPDGPERNRVISRFVLMHCCTKQHRWRLEADRTGTLSQIVTTYAASMGVADGQPVATPSASPQQPFGQPPPETQPSPMSTTTSTVSTSQEPSPPRARREISSQSQGSSVARTESSPAPARQPADDSMRLMVEQLRERNAALERELGTTKRERDLHLEDLQRYRKYEQQLAESDILDYFTPYETDPRMSVQDLLLEDISVDWARTGEVYSFIWPAHNRYVKIGYTSSSAKARVDVWQSCNPGAKLSWSETFQYPERIERLIHLQMAKHRYKISVCSNAECRRSHEEWFRLSIDDVNGIISEWAVLTRREPLYDSRRKITTRWRNRIENLDSGIPVTARLLLDVLDQEEREVEERFLKLSLTTPMNENAAPPATFDPRDMDNVSRYTYSTEAPRRLRSSKVPAVAVVPLGNAEVLEGAPSPKPPRDTTSSAADQDRSQGSGKQVFRKLRNRLRTSNGATASSSTG